MHAYLVVLALCYYTFSIWNLSFMIILKVFLQCAHLGAYILLS